MGDRFFGNAIREGQPISRDGFAAGLRGMSHSLDKMSIYGGKVSWSSDNVPKLIPAGPDPRPTWSGVAWINGHHWYADTFVDEPEKYGPTITNTSENNTYLKINYSTSNISLSIVDEMNLNNNRFPAGKHYYRLGTVKGDIHFNLP